MHLRRLDPDEREALTELHLHVAALQARTADLIAKGTPGLEWVQANLSDAASELVGMVNNSEPMSFR